MKSDCMYIYCFCVSCKVIINLSWNSLVLNDISSCINWNWNHQGNTLIVFKYSNYSHFIEFFKIIADITYILIIQIKSLYSGLYNILFILRWKSLKNLNVTHFLSKTVILWHVYLAFSVHVRLLERRVYKYFVFLIRMIEHFMHLFQFRGISNVYIYMFINW